MTTRKEAEKTVQTLAARAYRIVGLGVGIWLGRHFDATWIYTILAIDFGLYWQRLQIFELMEVLAKGIDASSDAAVRQTTLPILQSIADLKERAATPSDIREIERQIHRLSHSIDQLRAEMRGRG